MSERVAFGHYDVLQRDDGSLWELGRGAMGVTYKALDTDLQCPVALKVINADLMAVEVNRNRFLQEARAAAGLRHSNVASVYHLAKDEEQFFYAMEFIDGETTEAYVVRCGPMSVRSALRVAWQVSKALAAAARQQLVHGDIKPANIMIVADSEAEEWPFVKVIDFDLVRSTLRARNSASTTQSGFLGTVQFASPEQIEEGEVSVRSDIYSLGCTLWYLLTGGAPFTCSLAGVFAQYVGSEPPWEALEPFPKPVRRLLRRMLGKGVSQRPASAISPLRQYRAVRELRREIEQCLDDVERREAVAARITLPFNVGRRWMDAAPRSRIAVICSVCVIGLIFAFSDNGNTNGSPGSATPAQTSGVVPAQSSANSNEWFAKEDPGWSYLGTNPSSRSARAAQTSGWSYLGTNPSSRSVPAMQTIGAVPAQDSANPNQPIAEEGPGWPYLGTNPSSRPAAAMQTSGVVWAQDSANSNEWLAKERPGWSYLGTWDEPFRSLALARRFSFAETAAPDPGIIGAKSWLHGDSIWDAGVAKPVAVKDDSWRSKEGRFSMALASDYSFGVSDSEDEKAAMRKGSIRDKDKVKKTTKRSVKRPQRRVASRDRDRGFSPLQAVRRAREQIRRVIRRIL
jgi:serine/threonine protein kinase